MLEDPNAPQFKDMKAIPAVLKLSADEKERQAQIERLKTLISQGNPQARRIAIRQFARERGLDAVPTLLYALSDPDETATREARNALRFISRRLNGFGMPDAPSATEKAEAIEKWRNWYLQVRPEAELEPEDIAPSASAP
jgi:HEAT repeat protein